MTLRALATGLWTGLALAVLGSTARAQDAAALLERAEELVEVDPAAAAAALEDLADAADATSELRMSGARLALRELPFEAANRAAAALVIATLRVNRSEPSAWQLSFRIRDRVMDGLDLADGEPFLRSLIEIYPDQMRFRESLTDLYRYSGRPVLAEAECMEILRLTPGDTRARYVQAILCERDGRAAEALALYSEIHEISGDLKPLLYRVQMLIDPLCDYDAAARALDEAFAAVDAAHPGRERNEMRADLEYERERLASERERRQKLLRTAVRLDRVVVAILAGWTVVLGGGLTLLRRRGLV